MPREKKIEYSSDLWLFTKFIEIIVLKIKKEQQILINYYMYSGRTITMKNTSKELVPKIKPEASLGFIY